jgi:hypothetical protein
MRCTLQFEKQHLKEIEMILVNTLKGLAAITVIALVATTGFASAQAKAPKSAPPVAAGAEPKESVPATPKTIKPNEPLHDTWVLKNLNGSVNVVVNPDGTWSFGGGIKDKKPGQTFDVTFVIKSSLGSIYIFHWKGDASNGVEFNKTGKSEILHDDYKYFDHTNWSAEWVLHTFNKEALAKYEAAEKRKKEIAQTKAAEAALAADELKEEAAQAAAQKTEDTVAAALKLVQADKAKLAGTF